MNIGLIIFAIIGSIIGLASTFYIVISMFWILGVKILYGIVSSWVLGLIYWIFW